MTSAVPTADDVLETVDALGPPGTPVTTPEVAEGFDCTQRTIYNRLETLVEEGTLLTKKVGANSRVWWRPVDVATQNDGALTGRQRVRSHPVFASDLVGVLVWKRDPSSDGLVDLVIEDANEAFLEMAGLEYDHAVGTSWQTLTPEEFHSDSEAHIEQVLETGSGLAYDKQYSHPDGSRWWGLFESRLLDDGRFVEFVVDITERKEAEEQLRESEEKYRTLFESIDEGFFTMEVLFDEDDEAVDFRYLETNSAFEAITGYVDVEGERMRDLEPDYEKQRVEKYGRIALTGEPERFTNQAGYLDDRWFDVFAFRIGEPRERTVAVLFTDITERKRREQRDQFLLELSDQLHRLTDEEEIGEVCTRLLAEELELDRAYFGRFYHDAEEVVIGPEYHEPALDPVSGLYPFSSFPEAIRESQTETPVYDDVATDSTLPEAERQALLDLDFGAWVTAPIRRETGQTDWALYAVYADPHDWTEFEISLIKEVADRAWTAVERARAERALRASNESLERLNDASQELIDADPETIRNRVADLVVDILDVQYAALWQYDGQTGALELASERAATEMDLDAVPPSAVPYEELWDVFVDDEVAIQDALDVAGEESWPAPLGSRAVAPLGRHGVLVVAAAHAEPFDKWLVDLLQMVAATVETAWDRADSEDTLARQNEELTRLDHLNALIRAVDQALVGADSREAIGDEVCDQLANSERYTAAWLGTYEAATDSIRPQAWAGVDSGFLDDRIVTLGDAPGDDPLVAAHRTRELQVVSDIATDARAAAWREDALGRGARSVITIPLVYEESIYGLLTVYGRTPQPDDRETDVLAELGTTIAHAIHALEATTTRQANVVELTLRTDEAGSPLARLSRALDCELTVEGLIPSATGDALTVFFTATDVSPNDLVAASAETLGIADLDRLDGRENGNLYRARLSEGRLTSLFGSREAIVRSATIDRGTVRAVVDLPETGTVSEFLDDLREGLPDLKLLARTTRNRPLQTPYSLPMALDDRLTARQREVLQIAYESGFFESPRVQTGTDLAEALDISPSTFTYHLRESQRRLCEMVFEPS